jgi:glycoprotein-N-acetylgalactosamine 3-beta-galactosyltransferase
MVNTNTLSDAVAVRYSKWGKRCAFFVIVSNGVSGGEQLLDDNTVLVDIHHAIEMELQTRARDVDANERFDDVSAVANYSTYTTFPLPQNEIKEYLSLKSFYSWMYMARKFSDRVDYIMKADPDTFMLMDNYLQYLYEYYSPEQQVYMGRVFKTGGNFNDPFITGLSVTLSRATAKLLLSRSTIQGVKPDYHECSAERFRRNGGADDHVLAHCLRSVGVYPAFTRDEYGRERFLHFSPAQHFGTDQEPRWHKKFSFTPYSRRKGCCSSKACAFHYVGIEKQNATLYWSNFTHAWHFKKAA